MERSLNFGRYTALCNPSVRGLLATGAMLLLPGCASIYLDEAAELGIYSDTAPELLDVSSGAIDGNSHGGLDISGLYLSDITSNRNGYFSLAQRRMLLRVTQQGDQIIAFDSTYQLKLDGTIRNNTIEFHVYPAVATWSNSVGGTWTVEPGSGNLTGSWRANNHGAEGAWNLRKLGSSGVEFYTTGKGMHDPVSISEADDFFDELFSRDEEKNIVFYLHGRGGNFPALFDATGVPYIEAYSATRFVIIRWLSFADVTIRPYNHAITSASGVAEFLHAFDDYKSRFADRLGNRKITLLAHSMGNIPIAAFLQYRYQQGSLQEGLFDSIIFNSADVPFANHRQWIEKCDFAKQIFVTQHGRDYILNLSRIFFSPEEETDSFKLGTGLDPEDRRQREQLAGNAKYLDLTNLTYAGHKHFSQAGTLPLFKELLNGGKIDYPDPAIGLYRKLARQPVFYFYSSEPEQVRVRPDDN